MTMTGTSQRTERSTEPRLRDARLDVIVIGAGGSGLRAAIEAKERGLRVPSSASRCSARRTRSWPRGAWPPPWATSGRGQLAGPLPRPCAAADAQQLAHGADPRHGGARSGLRARALGALVRPHQRRPHHSARLRRPPLRPPGPRRRPHRAGADPHPPAEVVSMGTDVFMECKILRLRPTPRADLGGIGYMRPTGR